MSNERECVPTDGEQAIEWLAEYHFWCGSDQGPDWDSPHLSKLFQEMREKAKASRAYILDGLRYASERGWPDKPMMTRAECVDELLQRRVEAERRGPKTADGRFQEGIAIGMSLALDLGTTFVWEFDTENAVDLAHELALAEKREREAKEADQGNEAP